MCIVCTVGKSYYQNFRVLGPLPETRGLCAVWYHLSMCITCGCGEFKNPHGSPTVEAANVKFETTDALPVTPAPQAPETLAKK